MRRVEEPSDDRIPPAAGFPAAWLTCARKPARTPAGPAGGRRRGNRLRRLFVLFCFSAALAVAAYAAEPAAWVDAARLIRIGSVDPRYQSYNVEMLEVTGGRFWKPYKAAEATPQENAAARRAATPAGMDPNLYEYRPPLDLGNARLRKLAAALGPAYMRVSGTWANTTYFHNAGAAAPKEPPAGFSGVLSRAQWKSVVAFARAAHAELVTSVAISAGTRDAAGVWKPDQAAALLAYTKSLGGGIAAAEFMNEPNIAGIGGAPKGYDAAAYARDVAVFRPFLKRAAPGALFLGPGSVAEGRSGALPASLGVMRTEDLLQTTGPVYDVFSYHLYAAVSQRCAGMSPEMGTAAAAALSEEWLSRPDGIHAFYAGLRDRFEPGKPLWITETAGAACGGNPWSSTFLDTFRYLDQLGRLAQQGVRVTAYNTLAASDYGLLDEHTFAPRPNYWAALLWRKVMGTTVLKPDVPASTGLHVYAHCLRDAPGGIAVLAVNTDPNASKTLGVSAASERFTLTAPSLEANRVDLNGRELKLGADDAIPQLTGAASPSGPITIAPASITFLAIRDARNGNCR